MSRETEKPVKNGSDEEMPVLHAEISYDEKKILQLMRVFDLSYMELAFLFQEGLLPAIKALGNYKNPPWSKESLDELDEYYDVLSAKYEALYEFFQEGKNELH